MPPADVNQASGGCGGHGAYDQRIKVIANMLKKLGGLGSGGGVRVVMNKELKLLLKLQKKVRGVQSRGGVGVRVDANDELKLL